jgi:hypothetical protein
METVLKIFWKAVSSAPVEIIIGLSLLSICLLVLFRKKLRKAPMVLFILLFAFLGTLLPGFINQYQKRLGSMCDGLEENIGLFVKEGLALDSNPQLAGFSETLTRRRSDLEEIMAAKGFKKYFVVAKVFERRVEKSVLRHYSPEMAFNFKGGILALLGGIIGFLLWKIISWPFKLLFRMVKRKGLLPFKSLSKKPKKKAISSI